MKQTKTYTIRIKRIYAPAEKEDGARILVDRLWPRGIKKEDHRFEEWRKEIAPSNEVRKQYNHQRENYDIFQKAYTNELEHNEAAQEFLTFCSNTLKKENVTLLYSAKEEEHNNAVVLAQWLNQKQTGDIKNGK